MTTRNLGRRSTRPLFYFFTLFTLLTSMAASADPIQPHKVAKCSQATFGDFEQIKGKVSKIVDGDTVGIWWKGADYRIRMIGIDTPELHYWGSNQGYWAQAAQEHLAEKLPIGSDIRVRLKGDKCDHYGRILGEVFFERKSMNDLMLRDGFAVNYCIFPDDGCRRQSKLVELNVKAKRGIFSDPNLELPYIWRVKVSGRTHERFIGNLKSYDVHRPGDFDAVPIYDRVFFNRKRDIQQPYYETE